MAKVSTKVEGQGHLANLHVQKSSYTPDTSYPKFHPKSPAISHNKIVYWVFLKTSKCDLGHFCSKATLCYKLAVVWSIRHR